ncbi:hypothetical protein [Alphaproteobacteria bacterium endosymbiont of Tiliacea citrago]|uniref:hypothetical protein n=1 Tax=Alphaproteobacteria bacterium endosymbiont of Tiliacea citrago TaxID=3077944 RepID=UPI00313ABBA0
MFGFLKKYLFYEYVKIFFLVVLLFFPIIFFSDFLLSDHFSFLESLLKVPFRYGQMLGVLSFIGSYISIKRIIYIHGVWIFISLTLKKKDFVFSFLYLTILISSFFYFFIVPFNDKAFKAKKYVSKWAIQRKDKNIKFIYKDQNYFDVWEIKQGDELNHYKLNKNESVVKEKDFYIVWNETKKMSQASLEEYKEYMNKNKFSTENYYKQKHIYYSRFFVVLIMLMCGFFVAWDKSFMFFSMCFLFFNWFDLLAFFLPLKYCIVMLWGNILLWFFIALLNILF